MKALTEDEVIIENILTKSFSDSSHFKAEENIADCSNQNNFAILEMLFAKRYQEETNKLL